MGNKTDEGSLDEKAGHGSSCIPLLGHDLAHRNAVKHLVRELFADLPGSPALVVLENEPADPVEAHGGGSSQAGRSEGQKR